MVRRGGHQDYTTIQAAIDAAEDGATIWIQRGKYDENISIIGKSLTLLGGYSNDFSSRTQTDTTIDGSASECEDLPTVAVNYSWICAAGFQAAFTPPTSPNAVHVTLDGLTIKGGGDSGIVVRAPQDSVISLIDNTIEENAGEYGGGVRVRLDDRATLIMTGNVISHNRADKGGGVWVYGEQLDSDGGLSISTKVVIFDNEIHANAANSVGGIYVNLGRMTNVEINENYIYGNGFEDAIVEDSDYAGGIYLRLGNNSSGSFSNNLINGNYADYVGGAYLYLDDNVTLRFDGNEITGNTGEWGTGGLRLTANRNVRLEGETLTVQHNIGTGAGGANINLAHNSFLTLTQQLDASFNVAAVDDGAAYAGASFSVNHNSHVYLADLQVISNTIAGPCASCAGGGFAVDSMMNYSSFEIGNATVISNIIPGAAGGGGFVNFFNNSSFILHGGSFEENIAGTGGGLYVAPAMFGTRLQVSNTDFISNTAEAGGGLYLTDTRFGVSTIIEDSRFISNTAMVGGGLFISANYAAQCAEARFNRNQFIGNRATGGGGGLQSIGLGFVSGCHGEFKDNLFRSNSSLGPDGITGGPGGAAMFAFLTANGAHLTFTGNEFTDNHSRDGGGALYMVGIGENASGGGSITMSDNRFVGNTTQLFGGALFSSMGLGGSATLRFTHNDVISNTASFDGGGLYFGPATFGGNKLYFENNTVSSNVISYTVAPGPATGGGVYIGGINEGDAAWLTGNVITGNQILTGTVMAAGGGLFLGTVANNSHLYLHDNIISENTIASGWARGAACFFGNLLDPSTPAVGSSATVSFRRNTIAQNVSSDEIGGCYFSGIGFGAILNMYDNQFVGNSAWHDIGALMIDTVWWGTTLNIQRNTFETNKVGYQENFFTGGNYASLSIFAGPMFESGGSHVRLIDNVFKDNWAFASGDVGGMYAGPYLDGFGRGSVIQMKGNVIEDNRAAAAMAGATITLDSARLVAEDNIIARNEVMGPGVGSGLFVEMTVNSEAIILNNEIRENDAGQWASLTLINPALTILDIGDGVDPIFTNEPYAYSANNLIVDNQQGLTVEGVPFYSINDTIAHNDFYGISVQGVVTASVHLTNTILWGNNGPAYVLENPSKQSFTANYSIIQGGALPGTENLDLDPLFVDAAGGNYRLQAGSPAVNSALTAAAPMLDLDKIARPVPMGGEADRGAYEWHVAGVAALAPPSLPDVEPGPLGTTFLFTATNNGNIPETFLVYLTENQLGWPVSFGLQASSTDPFSIDLGPGESATFEVHATVPDGTIGGTANTLRFQAQSERDNTVVGQAEVTVVAANIAGVSLSPDHSSEAASDSQASYTHTLTNQGNFTDTITLIGVSDQGWAVAVVPAAVTLAPGASADVQVIVNVPADAGGQVDTTTVTAYSSAAIGTTSDQVVNTTTVPRTVGLQLSAGTLQSANPDSTVFFTHWITNTGNAQDVIALTYAVPNGWGLDAPASVDLAAGQGREILLAVTVPAGAAGTSGVVNVSAASTTDPAITGSAQDVVDVVGIQVIQISAGAAIKTTPGTTVSFDHTVTNAGTVDAALELSYQSAHGWVVTGPTALNLAPGASQDIQLQVTVPADAGGLIDVTTITVTPNGNPAGTVKAQDAVIVAGAGVQLLPNNVGSVAPGATVVYSHTLINTGDATDTFNLSYASSEGWAVDGPAAVEVEAGAAAIIEVAVTMPVDSEAVVDVTTVTATSQMDARQQASVTDTTYLAPKRIFLPRVYKNAPLGQ